VCYLEYLELITTSTKKEPPKSCLTVNNKIKLLKQCSWCKSTTSTHSEQGNIIHAFLRCTHPDLQHFRTNTNLIAVKEIQSFFQMLQHYNSLLETIRLVVQEIQNIFLDYQSSQMGRLRKLPVSINHSYISIKELLKKYNTTCIMECAFQPRSDFCLEIFGLLPNNLHTYINDAHIGIVDAPWLGLTPKNINLIITEHICTIETNTIQLPNRKQITKELKLKWNLIKGLILGKAIGLHRITGIISSGKEKDLRNRYNLEQGSLRELKRKLKQISHTKTLVCIDVLNMT